MIKTLVFSAVATAAILFSGCERNGNSVYEDVALQVTFGAKKMLAPCDEPQMTFETPENYVVALKKAMLVGNDTTPDFVLFEEPDLSSSMVFDYTDEQTVHSLLDGQEIPLGVYAGIEIEIYYLQMNIAIATGERGVERRNFRIYLSDDAEAEDGLHQPGDMTQINDGVEIGWLLGEGQIPNMDPVTPREAAYSNFGEGRVWHDFAGKPGDQYGPFGDSAFMFHAPHPVYRDTVDFTFIDKNGSKLILDFNVNNCWQFEDRSGDGVFGPGDLDSIVPTAWHMAMPEMTVMLD